MEHGSFKLASIVIFTVGLLILLASHQDLILRIISLPINISTHQQQQQLQQQLQSFWANQYQKIEKVNDFKNHNHLLPRIKKIMKADEDERMISAKAPTVFARACEMFILELTLRSWNHTEENKRRTLQKNDIAAAITRTDIFDFLVDIVPREDLKDKALALIPRGTVPVGGPTDAYPYYYMPAQHSPQGEAPGMIVGRPVMDPCEQTVIPYIEYKSPISIKSHIVGVWEVAILVVFHLLEWYWNGSKGWTLPLSATENKIAIFEFMWKSLFIERNKEGQIVAPSHTLMYSDLEVPGLSCRNLLFKWRFLLRNVIPCFQISKVWEVPVSILLKLTIPQTSPSQWNRFYRSVNIVLCPLALLYSCNSFMPLNYPISFLLPNSHFPVWLVVLFACSSLAVLHYIVQKEPPKTEEMPRSAHSICDDLLAWENLVGDLVADVAVAKAGQPALAMASCFAGPMLNMLFGLGMALVIQTANVYPKAYELHFHVRIVVAFVFLLLSLMGSLLVITWYRFRVPRFWGFCLVGLYVSFIAVSLVIAKFTL
ncbi:hypothetical protein ACSBR2_018151 [Camellia fascicularis]